MKRIMLLLLLAAAVAVSIAGCAPKKPDAVETTAPSVEDAVTKEQVLKEARDLIQANAEPEKIVALIDANIAAVGEDGAEILLTGLEQLQESHLEEYTDLLLTDENQAILMEIQGDLNAPAVQKEITNAELQALMEKLTGSGYRFENFEGAWYPIVNYDAYRKQEAYVSQELKDYIELMAAESDRVSVKDAAITIPLEDLGKRLAMAEDYILRYPASVRVERVKDTYATYLWNFIGGTNNSPIFDWETKQVREEVLKVFTEFNRTHPDLNSTKAVRSWMSVLKDHDNMFDEEALYEPLNNIYTETLKDLGIETDYK